MPTDGKHSLRSASSDRDAVDERSVPVIAIPDPPQPDLPQSERRKILAAIGLTAAGLTSVWPGTAAVASEAATTQRTPDITPPLKTSDIGASQALASRLARQALEDTDTSSISMALISGQGVIWAQALGTDHARGQELQHDAVLSTDTLYCIGSCSKLFATVATLQLVDRGLVDLDTSVVRYLPSFVMHTPEYRDVTVRMLLNHQSGFPGSDYSNAFTTLPYLSYSSQVLETLSRARLKHSPGEMSVYCNDGFTVIEQLVQAVTGVAYVDYIQRNILDPLGMKNSRYAVQLFPHGSFAPGKTPSGASFLECINVYASGGLFTTPTEMAEFARMFLNRGKAHGKTVLSSQAIDAMAQLQAVRETLRPVPVEWGFGLGWDNVMEGGFAAQGIRAWRKNGGTSVYGSDFYVLPDHDLAFMITGTSTRYQPDVIAEEVLFEALRERGAGYQTPIKVTDAAKSPGAMSPNASDIQAMPGIYANAQAVFRITVAEDGSETLKVDKWEGQGWKDEKWMPARWTDHARWKRGVDGLFSGPDAPQARFGLAYANNRKYLTLHTPSGAGYAWLDIPFAQALSPAAPIPEVWRTRLNQTWIVINERYTSLILAWGGPTLRLFTIPDLNGYLGVNVEPSSTENQLLAVKEVDAGRMIFKIPYTMGRDLNDLLVERHDGIEHLRWGRLLFRSVQGLTSLTAGMSISQTVPGSGFALGFTAPLAVEIALDGALAAFVYDHTFKPVFPTQFRVAFDATLSRSGSLATTQSPATLSVPEGGLILVYVHGGQTVTLRVST